MVYIYSSNITYILKKTKEQKFKTTMREQNFTANQTMEKTTIPVPGPVQCTATQQHNAQSL